MIAAYLQVGLRRVVGCGDTPSQVFLNAQRVQDYEALLRMTDRMGDYNDKRQAERLRKEYLEPALAGSLTMESLRLLAISLPVGDVRCLCIAEGPDALNAIGQWIEKVDQQADVRDAETGMPSDYVQTFTVPGGQQVPFHAAGVPFGYPPPFTAPGWQQTASRAPNVPLDDSQRFAAPPGQAAGNDIPVLDYWDIEDLDPENMTADDRRRILRALEELRDETEADAPDPWDDDETQEWQERLNDIDEKIEEFEDLL